MRKYFILCFSLVLTLFASCQSESGNRFHITATITGMPPMQVMIKEVGFQNSPFLDSTRSKEDGTFELSGTYQEPGLYNIKLGANFLTVVINQPEMNIKADWNDLSNIQVSGSPATVSLHRFNTEYGKLARNLIGLRTSYDSLMNDPNISDSVLKAIELDISHTNQEVLSFIKGYADTTQCMTVAIYAASYLLTTDEADYLEDFTAKLSKRFPTDVNSVLLQDFRAAAKGKIAEKQARNKGPAVGAVAPAFKVSTLEGGEVALNDFKGQYVLLDFWASWCPPCRAENPNIVTAYRTYKSRNFTVLSFSLDDNKSKWEQAVKNDRLDWTQASDLKGWGSSVASLYGIESIPMNFLINPEGKVIARNLRGSQLEATLQNQLPQPADKSTSSTGDKAVAAGK